MNKLNPYLITIQEQIPGQYTATTLLDAESTAKILFNLALNFVRQSAIEKYEKQKEHEGAVINPHTGKTMLKGH